MEYESHEIIRDMSSATDEKNTNSISNQHITDSSWKDVLDSSTPQDYSDYNDEYRPLRR